MIPSAMGNRTTRRVLPVTVAEMLERELVDVHRQPPLREPHSWDFTAEDVDDARVDERMIHDEEASDAYLWLAMKLDIRSSHAPYAEQLRTLCERLMEPEILRSRLISPWVKEAYHQLARLGDRAAVFEIRRVNRVILEELFPDGIRKARDAHLSETVKRLHNAQPTALCLSGGGIRSATFALGVLQGLARVGDGGQSAYPIESIDYLSTVSGGGYIGGWLSAWILRAGGRFSQVLQELRNAAHGAFTAEPPQVAWLREYSNYLAPRFSLFSVDTATLAATWIRNVLINWLIFLPFLGLLMILPRIIVVIAARRMLSGWPSLMIGTLLAMASVALIASGRPRKKTQNRPGRLRRIAVARITTLAAALVLPIYWAGVSSEVPLGDFCMYGVVVQLVGTVWHLARHHRRWWRTLLILFGAVVSGAAAGLVAWLLVPLPWLRPPIRWPELYALTAPPLLVGVLLLAGIVFTALSRGMARNELHEYWNRLGASLLIGAVVYLIVGAISIYGPILVALSPKMLAAVGGVTGLIGIILGYSGISPALDKEDTGRTVSDHMTAVLIPVFVTILLAGISWGITAMLITNWRGTFPHAAASANGLPRAALDHLTVLQGAPLEHVASLAALLALVALIASFFADINRFSMHALYRMRLVRAYLGASNYLERNPDPFTGFDINDSVVLSELAQTGQKPFHVVNMALNLVRGKRLAWQQRKASTFTASPLYWGNWQLGYRDTANYGKRGGGLDLGTAMTISGAAASPNMGYHSSPPLSFLLAMFNVRLGAWLGNPGVFGGRVTKLAHRLELAPPWQRSSPRSSLAHQLAEAFGWTDDEHRYVYLSDGGHFENLGLYEMVLRRCRYVIVSDAGADHQLDFEDLGNAVRKIRIDFGIPIDFDRFAIASRDEQRPGAHCALGTIRYSAVDGANVPDGQLLYIKASYYGTGPQDVRQYAHRVRRFPHESTGDQFFTESQFESYRKLGEWVVEEIVGSQKPATMEELFEAARRYQRRHGEVLRW